MTTKDGRFTIVFNGEIYNTPALRAELVGEGHELRTSSDTEVVLAMFQREGVAILPRLRGMFAFAIWDNLERSMFLARDPYGIKPLYVSDDGWTFRFASQVKALLAGRAVSREIEPAGLVGFYLWGSVPEPFTLYRDIRQVPAGHFMRVDSVGPREAQKFDSVQGVMASAIDARPSESVETSVRTAVLDSVRHHMLSDVEVGVFLSSGIDSGALLGCMRDISSAPIRAVTIAFEEFLGTHEDEVPLATEIASRYGAEHIVRTVSKSEYEKDLADISRAMDQPSIDGINTWFVAKACREAGLKVALSGVGGDELFAGYPSFRDIPRWVGSTKLPGKIPGLGRVSREFLKKIPNRSPKFPGLIEYGHSYAGAYLLRRGVHLPFELGDLIEPAVAEAGLRRLDPIARVTQCLDGMRHRSPVTRVSCLESSLYMRNQLLRDSDWAGMAHSLEIRTPLVDIQLLRELASFQSGFTDGKGKRMLARAPRTDLPAGVLGRPKTGFGVPMSAWSRSDSKTATKGEASRDLTRRVLAAELAWRP